MKLGTRFLAILSITSMVAMAGTIGIASYYLIDGHRAAEEETMRASADQVQTVIAADLQELEATAQEIVQISMALFASGSFAAGDETTAADASGSMAGPGDANMTGQDDPTQALAATLFAANRLDVLFFYGAFNETGGPAEEAQLFGMRFDAESGELVQDVPAALNASILASEVLTTATPFRSTSGVVPVESTAYMAAAHALPSALLGQEGPPIVLAVGREIGATYTHTVAQRTGLDLALSPAPGYQLHSDFELRRHGLDAMTASATAAPSLRAEIYSDRPLFQQGMDSIIIFSSLTVILLGGVAILAWVLVRSSVTLRIQRLDEAMQRIAGSDDLSQRADLPGGDEIAAMGAAFDRLMGRLQARTHELEQSNQDLDHFASVASHDLMSPMSTIALNVRLLESVIPEDHEAGRRYLDRMRRTADHIETRVRGILAYARATSEDRPLVPIDPTHVIKRVLADMEATVQDTGLEVEIGELPMLIGDEEQLARLFQNLLANSAKYAHPERLPKVHISFEASDGVDRIVFEDNGRGFDPGDAQRMMEPFTRLDNAQDREGMGMGLATCSRIVASHGGSIHADGRPGGGARFRLDFPSLAS